MDRDDGVGSRLGATHNTTGILAAADLVVVAIAVWATTRSWVPNETGAPTFALGPTLFTSMAIVVFCAGLFAWIVLKAQGRARGNFVASTILALMVIVSHLSTFG